MSHPSCRRPIPPIICIEAKVWRWRVIVCFVCWVRLPSSWWPAPIGPHVFVCRIISPLGITTGRKQFFRIIWYGILLWHGCPNLTLARFYDSVLSLLFIFLWCFFIILLGFLCFLILLGLGFLSFHDDNFSGAIASTCFQGEVRLGIEWWYVFSFF